MLKKTKCMVEELYESSQKGCASILTTLIQRDALILREVSLTSLKDTPLHIAALHGHLEFCRLLLSKKPTFAKDVDALGRTPLHLASAEGHIKIVQALLQENTDVCLASNRDERIPLHLAAIRGRIEIVKELISARPESIKVNLNGESVLHLCVQYNQLDALKLLVESASGDELFLNSKDHNGNSKLHLAMLTIYLLPHHQTLTLSQQPSCKRFVLLLDILQLLI
ncbi:ankyrin repeat-containing protein BDA1-like [Corylus avellana]|uniref:ankyrin repeat-containing protein BDA1-like n=1 Tax=Corylus avellana TaxID=13451 RepID=UPI00286C20D4|nr:ankyrin repeat-containing protein BDA1-like [Corylus avellana]